MEAKPTAVKRRIFLGLLALALLCQVLLSGVEARHHGGSTKQAGHKSRAVHTSAARRGRASVKTARSRGTVRRHSTQASSVRSGRRARRRSAAVAESRHVRGRSRRGRALEVKAGRGKWSHSHAVVKKPQPDVEPVFLGSTGIGKIYALYDQGLNARLLGNSAEAINQLKKAARLIRMEPRPPSGKGLTMEAMIDFELGQAAEADNNMPVAIEAFEECLKVNPHHIDASVRLTAALLRSGQPLVALIKARDAVDRDPKDPRARTILAVALEKNGFGDDAKNERQKAAKLLRGQALEAQESRPPVVPAIPLPSEHKVEEAGMDIEPNAEAKPVTAPTTDESGSKTDTDQPDATVDEKLQADEKPQSVPLPGN